MISLLLTQTILWYIGALFILWQVTLMWRRGLSFMRLAPSVAIIFLMLVDASFVYYDYVGTPADTLVQYLWILAVFTLIMNAMSAVKARQ